MLNDYKHCRYIIEPYSIFGKQYDSIEKCKEKDQKRKLCLYTIDTRLYLLQQNLILAIKVILVKKLLKIHKFIKKCN